MTAKLRVADGRAVCPPGRSQHVTGGQVVEVDADTAAHWIARGWAEPVDDEPEAAAPKMPKRPITTRPTAASTTRPA